MLVEADSLFLKWTHSSKPIFLNQKFASKAALTMGTLASIPSSPSQPDLTHCTLVLSAHGADAKTDLIPQHTAVGSTSYNEKCIVPAQYPQTCWQNCSWLRVKNAAQENVRKCHHPSLWSHRGEWREFVSVLNCILLNSCQVIYACSNRHTYRCINKISCWDPQQAAKP